MTHPQCWRAADVGGKLYLCVLPRGHKGIHHLSEFHTMAINQTTTEYCGHERLRNECAICWKAEKKEGREEGKETSHLSPGVYTRPDGKTYYIPEMATNGISGMDAVVYRDLETGKLFTRSLTSALGSNFTPAQDRRSFREKILSVVKWGPCLTSEVDFRLRSIGTKVHHREAIRDAILLLMHHGNLKFFRENDYRTIAFVRDLDATAKG